MARKVNDWCSLTQGEVTGEADFITATNGKQRVQVAVGQAITFESYPQWTISAREVLYPKGLTSTKTVLLAGDQAFRHTDW